jgi:uncharacterized repeat protein (TIGR01451 family)
MLALAGLALVVLVVFVPGSGANLAPSSFNAGDGNMVVDQGDTLDWANLSSATPPVAIQTLNDTPSGQNDTSFSNGSTKEDDLVANVGFGSIPGNKDDVLHAYLAAQDVSGKSFLYLAWVRANSTGDAHIDFELDQNATPGWTSASTGQVTINRTDGDRLIAYDFGGSGAPDISLFRWNGTTKSWDGPDDLSSTGLAEAQVDHLNGPITDTVANESVGTDDFGEASINLTDALHLDGADPCATFGSMTVKTRASGSGISAQLKDYIAPVPIHVSTCGTVELKKQWVRPDGAADSTTLRIGTSAGGTQVTSKLVNSDDTTGSQQVVSGQYFVSENPNPVPGYGTPTLACENDKNPQSPTAVNPGADGSVQVNVNDAIVCTFTNTFTKLTPTTVTTLKNAASNATVPINTHLALGSGIYDTATFTGAGAFALTGTVTFNFFKNAACTGTPDSTQTGVAISAGTATSSSHLNLGAGSYAFNAQYVAGSDPAHGDSAVSTCEPFTVDKGVPTSGTTLKNAAGDATIQNGSHLALGSGVYDTAQIGNDGGFPLTGAVTFQFYSGGNCTTGTPVAQTGATLTNGGATSSQHLNLPAGSYAFDAQYVAGSDPNHADSLVSSCEPFTVDKATPSAGTTLKNAAGDATVANGSHLALGSGIYDTAQITDDGGFPLTGTVTFRYYTGGDCATGTPVAQTGATLTNGVATSSQHLNLAAGSYAFDAKYVAGADPNHSDSAVSSCEPFTVDKGTPSSGTTLKNAATDATVANGANLALGSGIYDTAQITDAGGFPLTGTVTFRFYSGGDCSTGTPVAQTGTVVTNGSATSSQHLSLAAGNYAFDARYVAGADPNHTDSAVSSCEPFTVDKITPSAATTLKNAASDATVANGTHLPLGSGMYDTAQIGNAGGFPLTGTVTFELFTNATCAGTPDSTQTGVALVAGSATSSQHLNLGAGDYAFDARYVAGSDPNHGDSAISSCEPFTIDKGTPSSATTLKNAASDATVANGTHLPLGSGMYDTAQIGNAGGFPLSGTVTFELFTNATCAGTPDASQTGVALVAGSATSSQHLNLGAGEYAFDARYVAGSDPNHNDSAISSCEPFTIDKAELTLGTTIHDAAHAAVADNSHIALGSVVHDTAQVGGTVGAFTPGAVSFTFFPNASCTVDTGAAIALNGTAEGNGDARTVDTQALAAGGYSFKASVAGNGNYVGAASACEPFTVDKAQLDVSTLVHDAQHADITDQSVVLGSLVHDTAHVSGAVQGFDPTGGVTFTFYNGPACTSGQAVATDGTEAGGDLRTVDELMLVSGSYGFKATVVGDSNYLGATGACEPFGVSTATTSTVTAIQDAQNNVVTSVPLGSVVHDVASVSSGNASSTPTGDVTFTFFTNGTCTGEGSPAGTVALDANGVAKPSSSEGPLQAGDYSFRASYGGDGNFVGSTGDCEPLTVTKADSTTATTIHDSDHGAVTSVALGSTVHDSASVSSANDSFDPTGNVSFVFYSNADCTGEGASAGSKALDTSGVADGSSSEGPLTGGSYGFKATYAGDSNFNGSTGPCEPLTVAKADTATATTIHDVSHAAVTEVLLGSTVHDSASVTSQNGAFKPSGGVTFTFFTNGTCTGESGTSAGTVQLDGNGVAHPSADEGPLNTAGAYSFRATYAGDSNFNGSTGACEPLQVDGPAIAITKNPATQALDSGGTANFTITVTNTGTVTLTNVTVTDPLSPNCNKTVGTLTPGQSTTYTCSQANVTAPFTNVATAKGHPPVGPDVTASASANVTVNTPPPPSSPPPSVVVPTVTDLAIVKTAEPTSVLQGKNVTYTLTVTNNGPLTDTNVQVADSLPFGVTFVSVTPSQGTCTSGTVVQCSLGTLTVGQKVTILIVVHTVNTGSITNTATVVGALPETTLANNTSSAAINVTAPPQPKPAPVFKPPVVKPKPKPVPPPCYAVVVAPKSLSVGKSGKLRLRVSAKSKAIAGVKVKVTGPGIAVLSGRTNSAGKVTVNLHPKKPGIVLVKPASYKGCTAPRVGVIAAFTPPVTG